MKTIAAFTAILAARKSYRTSNAIEPVLNKILKLISLVLPAALASDVTLWQLAEETGSPGTVFMAPGFSVEISPISVQTDGQTVYVAKEAKSLIVAQSGAFTTTILATPTTNTCKCPRLYNPYLVT